MSASNLLVLGLLLLTANLSLCALFAPSRLGGDAADRLVQLWKLLLLAGIEVGAWAVVLFEGGAASSLLETFIRCASCFVLAGGEGGGFAPPWGEMKPFIALNGLLFVPVALIPWMAGTRASRTLPELPEEPLQIPPVYPPLSDPHPAPVSSPPASYKPLPPGPPLGSPTSPVTVQPSLETPSDKATPALKLSEPSAALNPSFPKAPVSGPPPLPVPAPSQIPVPIAASAPEHKPFGFRPTIPKVQPRLEPNSPEAELAEQMKPIGPTPPPIRFRWNDEPR